MAEPKVGVSIGGREVGHFVTNLRVRAAVNEIPEASFTLVGAQEVTSLDWQGEVVIAATDPREVQLFTGVVTSAQPRAETADGLLVKVECRGSGITLQEMVLGGSLMDLPPHDAMHWLFRSNHWPEDRLDLGGLESLPREPFEVATPVSGLTVERACRVGEVTLVPPDRLWLPLTEDEASRQLLEAMVETDVVAVTYVDAARTFDAEQEGLRRIDLAMGWLTSRAQDGTMRRSGLLRPFDRRVSLAHARRSEPTLVRGVNTRRYVIHRPSKQVAPPLRLGGDEVWATPPLHPGVAPTDALAVLAWDRASSELITEQKVQALWDAIEFYAGSAVVPAMFDRSLRRSISRALRGLELNAEQRARVDQLVGQLNAPPLLTRLRHAAASDGVVISEYEMEILRRLRAARNLTSHGRPTEPVRAEDLRHGLSIVARLMGARAATQARSSSPARGYIVPMP